MRIEATPFKRRKISMTSLIDVIFLLLLFFMLSSTFSRFSDVELNSGAGRGSSQDIAPAFLKLTDNGLTLNGRSIKLEMLGKEVATLQVSANINGLILSVDETASAQQFVDVLTASRRLSGISLQVVK
ncbi:biopolymer transporter ExbD [Ahrensia kielensis]|uniref:biopolymer transporter ExbD n=1 Tax=Ahrensia kielensis TaxID=76980 RepID=UPI000379B6E4|nr:biopolymer transporter ExbD [Ahrensia kielensis]